MKWSIGLLSFALGVTPALAQEGNWWAYNGEMLGTYAKACKAGATDLVIAKDAVTETGMGNKKTAMSFTDRQSGGTSVTFTTLYFDLADGRKLEVEHVSGAKEGDKITATVQDKAGKPTASYIKCK
jgi:hypothetical protein